MFQNSNYDVIVFMPTKWSFALSACPCFTFTHARLYTRRVNSYLRSNKIKTKLKTHPVKNHVIVPIHHFVALQTIVKFVFFVAAPVTLLSPSGNKAGKILFFLSCGGIETFGSIRYLKHLIGWGMRKSSICKLYFRI